ncbi:sigma-70 family RNA polymerase sigma factor [Mucilaginibacter sp. ZT4R22]|uniref:Sigma-70 family RNA polymerase sigma factor n=1 Tax=Mucilaginibacter pankratovii TaxID=2772110 RepID=A0ABR7WMK5_9SPHI|nr:sigma-70 family RNA polymerase sigma factor [Mucilaginibacter pankratovii]MBD1362552.1 sigma-70 family RNA polymerase sigma factor [Mucilaginibacter pankratovii]
MVADKENLAFLLQQLRQGNEHAFTSIYDFYSHQLYRNILRLVKEEDIAQELLQDLFLKIWENRHNIKLDTSFKSYLYKIAENLVYGHFRKMAKDKRLIERMVLSSTAFDTFAEETIINKENHELLQLAIESLAPQKKLIYTLCKLEGKSYEEVSHELGIATSTIRNQIVKANKDVKLFFSKQDLAIMIFTIQILKHL